MQKTEHAQNILKWHEEMERNLRSEYSWLSLFGLFWLTEGENKIGSQPGNTILLPDRFPELAGVIYLKGEEVTIVPNAGVSFTINLVEAIDSEISLKADITGEADIFNIEDFRMMLDFRNGQAAIRAWDPQSNIRKDFRGRLWFNIDSDFRIEAEIINYEPAKSVMVDDILGFQQEGKMDAALKFSFNGELMMLDAQRLSSGAYYVIFNDQTAGNNTYNSGRYLVTEISDSNNVVIDFNRAYNPPCAFTNFATCPLPRPENILPIQIEAGEKFAGPV